MPFQINGGSPPAGAIPPGEGFWFEMPESTGLNGEGEPVGAVGKPRIRIRFGIMNETAWNWWAALTGTALSATLTSVQFWNPFKSGGADWDTWTGGAILHRPTYESISGSNFQGVEILISELVAS